MKINFKSAGVLFTVDLPAKINVVAGPSATGKTYFVTELKYNTFAQRKYSFPVTQTDVDNINPLSESLIVIDRADLLDLSGLDMVNDTNVYLLFGRYLPDYLGERLLRFIWEGNTITGGPVL